MLDRDAWVEIIPERDATLEGISIVGGLFLSQILTLYTTPVMFLYMDRFGNWTSGFWNKWYHGMMGDKPEDHIPTPPKPAPAE